jgi:outer membrane protein insertion porin family
MVMRFGYLFFFLIFLNVSLSAQVLNEIRIDGNKDFSNQQLLPLIKSRWQSVIDTSQIKLDQNSIANFYQEEGFIDVSVEYLIVEMPSKSAFDLEFNINERELYSFGKIEVSGLGKLSKGFLLKLMDLRGGLPFSKKIILKSQLKAMASGMFHDLQIKAAAIDTFNKQIPVNIIVEERKQNALSIGTGIDTDDGVKFFSAWKKRSIGGWGRGIELRGLYAVDYDNSLYFKKGNIGTSYTEPILFNANLLGKLNIDYISDKPKNTNFGYQRFFIETNFIYQLSMIYELIFRVRLQNDRLFSVPYAQDTRRFEEKLFLDNNRFISVAINRDSRDDLVDPSNGSLFSLLIEKAGHPFGGENNYWKIFFEGSFYNPLNRKIVIAQKFALGIIGLKNSIENFPSYLRFFLGGSGGVRGFAERSLGPQNPDGSRQGGNFLYLYNFEIRYYLGYNLNIVTFFDAGNVWLENKHATIHGLNYSAGTGIRLRTYFGFFRLDFGIKLSDFSTENLGRVHFGFGQSF